MMPRVLFKRAGGGVSSILSAQPRGAGSAPAMEPLSPPPAPDEETPPRLTPPRPPGPAQARPWTPHGSRWHEPRAGPEMCPRSDGSRGLVSQVQ
ncbi:programmed cell death protein 7-like isoform X2 [Strigops habroptila]|uniref:programmed cell death protein 7-like isoform X2 n=1 Tax=Strigops habroptila TaxID=2489341 RepID=UPI0011CF5A71|nr:programmed cell death protein 7-like isoform X2 [Strigops habroptila]